MYIWKYITKRQEIYVFVCAAPLKLWKKKAFAISYSKTTDTAQLSEITECLSHGLVSANQTLKKLS